MMPPKPPPLQLSRLEALDVDLAAEDLLHAAHEAAAGLLVVVQVEELAARCDAAGRVHHPVAERAALAALVQLVGGACGDRWHEASVEREPRPRAAMRPGVPCPSGRPARLGKRRSADTRQSGPSSRRRSPDGEEQLVVALVVAHHLAQVLEEALGHARGHLDRQPPGDRLGFADGVVIF